MGHLIRCMLLYERIPLKENGGDVVNPGVAPKASEFEFTQNAHKNTTKAT